MTVHAAAADLLPLLIPISNWHLQSQVLAQRNQVAATPETGLVFEFDIGPNIALSATNFQSAGLVDTALKAWIFCISLANSGYVAVGGGNFEGTSGDPAIASGASDPETLQLRFTARSPAQTGRTTLRWCMHSKLTGLDLAFGDGGTIQSSTDTINWTQRHTDVNTADDLAGACENSTMIVAVGSNGAVCVSADGLSWAFQKIADEDLRGVVWTGRRFVAVGWEHLFTSADGKQWAPGPAHGLSQVTNPAWNGSLLLLSGYAQLDGLPTRSVLAFSADEGQTVVPFLYPEIEASNSEYGSTIAANPITGQFYVASGLGLWVSGIRVV